MPLLTYDTVSAGTPTRYLYLLHGIFGAGRNWASVARRLVKERADWGVRLIDLRQHGSSQGFAAPHTVASAAADLAALGPSLGEEPAGVMGHSLGGKVALMYARAHGEGLEQIWVIDSTPEARPPSGSAWEMLELVRSLPGVFANRDELIGQLTRGGVALPVAQWMATNLEHDGSAYRWRFDTEAIEALLRDFFVTDLWDVVETPPGSAQLHVVKGRESSVLSGEAVSRISGIAAKEPRVFFHEVAGGHWLNAENPEALHTLLVEHL